MPAPTTIRAYLASTALLIACSAYAATDSATQTTYRDLSTAELRTLQSQRTDARILATALTASSSPDALDATDLDDTWSAWINDRPTDREELLRDINAMGAAFGDILVRELGFQWQYCKDAYGEGPCVVTLRGRGDVTIFPADFVAKRHDRNESPFFEVAVLQIAGSVQQMRDQWDKPKE